MFLFQIFVIALCSLRRCQTMITHETIRNLQQTELVFMPLKFSDTTCYTPQPENPRTRCVSIPKVAIDYKPYGLAPPFTVTEQLSHSIFFTGISLATTLQDADNFMAYIREPYCCRAVNQSLQEVMDNCIKNECYVEAIIRLMNVIESEGISILSRLFHISNTIIKNLTNTEVNTYLNRIDPIIQLIYNKFKTYFISPVPVHQIVDAIYVLRVKRSLKKRKQFFNDSCMEFSQRYGNMMGLASAGNYTNVEDIPIIRIVNLELETIIERANVYFKRETGAGPWPDYMKTDCSLSM
ncbi:uncharacterized protein LOC126842113 [Adelges cooleyi]|uniref:uncharacterized protein LOC126842113 n=1 Tax=Adelges cooleyi TaxID=133065 RepID=UPI00217F6BD9|nr:uncharacterized protein LOC126842113 [Adelges cooleyi]